MDFFGLTNCLTESIQSVCLLVHKEIKFLSVSGALSLEVTNKSGTAKVLSTNLNQNLYAFFRIGQNVRSLRIEIKVQSFYDIFSSKMFLNCNLTPSKAFLNVFSENRRA